MRITKSTGIAGCLVLALAIAALAIDSAEGRTIAEPRRPLIAPLPAHGDLPDDQWRAPDPSGARIDTVDFGSYDAQSGKAVMGETWTWDHGLADPLEGWASEDLTASSGSFRRISTASWAGHQNAVAAPIPTGVGALWAGKYEDEATALCWDGGLGYGDSWAIGVGSPALTYTGSGNVQISLRYFSDTESCCDYASVKVAFPDGAEINLTPSDLYGQIGDPSIGDYKTFTATLTSFELVGQSSFRLVFEFHSDPNWSDEDGGYATDYGPFSVDDVAVTGAVVGGNRFWGFEAGDDGFAETTSPIGKQMGVAPYAGYNIPITCGCRLEGNVLEMHDDTGHHPEKQFEYAWSPPADRTALGPSYDAIFAEWDLYRDLPNANGVFFAWIWRYYPVICPVNGQAIWSERLASVWTHGSDQPGCDHLRGGNDDLPTDAQLYQFGFALINDCEAFGIPPEICTHVSNVSPLFDNVRIRMTSGQRGPAIAFDPGARFQDGFGQGPLLATTNAGNADIAYDVHFGGGAARLGDSLVVRGPIPSASTKWEAKLWWRVRREGPAQSSIAGYTSWKNSIADGLSIVGPLGNFTFGRMDSLQAGAQVSKNAFISEFREDDDDFVGELLDANEMIRDGILAPGTQIQYFVTAAYITTPTRYTYLPDTTGANFEEFEILPSFRNEGGVNRYPCVLYVDAFNGGGERVIESALNVARNGAAIGAPIPNPTTWDRYDYLDAAANWNAPLARAAGGNNGVPLAQLLGYRTILVNTGSLAGNITEASDWSLLDSWLTSTQCGGNTSRQAILANGDNLATTLSTLAPTFLNQRLGASALCDAYHDGGCGPSPADESDCVRIEDAAGATYASDNSGAGGTNYAYDASGNLCSGFSFDVLGVTSGVGNRSYFDHDGTGQTTSYEQVTRSVLGTGTADYRSVLDGVSWHHLSARDLGQPCASDEQHVVGAAADELKAALQWVFGGVVPWLCTDPCSGPVDVEAPTPASGTTALLGVAPNPFNPRAVVRFSLASAGLAELVVYDVAGREVRTLMRESLSAGPHEAVWDGRDDRGHSLGSGVYWCRLRAAGYESARRMIRLP